MYAIVTQAGNVKYLLIRPICYANNMYKSIVVSHINNDRSRVAIGGEIPLKTVTKIGTIWEENWHRTFGKEGGGEVGTRLECSTSRAAGFPPVPGATLHAFPSCSVSRGAERYELRQLVGAKGCWLGSANVERAQGISPRGSLSLQGCGLGCNPLMTPSSRDALLEATLPELR